MARKPVLIAAYLSRTGCYERAQIMSSVALAVLIVSIGIATGGITSFAAVWLVCSARSCARGIAPRRDVRFRASRSAAAGLLYFAAEPDFALASSAVLMASGVISAALYATGLALGSASLARASSRLLVVEEDRYRLLARNIADVITRHRRNGTVRFASPAAEELFGVPAKSLLGHGLFDRVHVADRPAYLTALSEAAAQGVSSSVEFRIREELPGEHDAPSSSGWRCVAARSTGAEGEPDSEREVVAAIRDVTERKVPAAGGRGCARRSRAGQCRQEPLPRHHEPRAAHAARPTEPSTCTTTPPPIATRVDRPRQPGP